MKRKQRPNVSLLLWLTKEFIILSILSLSLIHILSLR